MKLEARHKTSDVLSEIDSLIEEVRDSAAKIAFNNLFPIDEDDDAAGKAYQKRTFIRYNIGGPETGRQFTYYCTHPASNEEDWCTACWYQFEIDGSVEYGSTSADSKSLLPFQPFIVHYSYLEDPASIDWEFENYQEEVVAAVGANDRDALEYSLEFFGTEYSLRAGYGGDTVPFDELTTFFDALGIDWRSLAEKATN
jgi:hypothetical protein